MVALSPTIISEMQLPHWSGMRENDPIGSYVWILGLRFMELFRKDSGCVFEAGHWGKLGDFKSLTPFPVCALLSVCGSKCEL